MNVGIDRAASPLENVCQGELMPTKTQSKRSSKAKRTLTKAKRTLTKTGAKRVAGGRRSAQAAANIRKTAVKVLAGAAAGAVRAMIPPLEKVADSSEETAGTGRQRGEKVGRSAG